MNRATKINDRPEGGICEQFGYLPKFVVYTNSSGVNLLGEILPDEIKTKKQKED